MFKIYEYKWHLSKEQRDRNKRIRKHKREGGDLYIKRRIPKWKIKMMQNNNFNMSVNSEKEDTDVTMGSDKDLIDKTMVGVSALEEQIAQLNTNINDRKRKIYNGNSSCEPKLKKRRIDTRSNRNDIIVIDRDDETQIKSMTPPIELLSNVLYNGNNNMTFNMEQIKESIDVVLNKKQNNNYAMEIDL